MPFDAESELKTFISERQQATTAVKTEQLKGKGVNTYSKLFHIAWFEEDNLFGRLLKMGQLQPFSTGRYQVRGTSIIMSRIGRDMVDGRSTINDDMTITREPPHLLHHFDGFVVSINNIITSDMRLFDSLEGALSKYPQPKVIFIRNPPTAYPVQVDRALTDYASSQNIPCTIHENVEVNWDHIAPLIDTLMSNARGNAIETDPFSPANITSKAYQELITIALRTRFNYQEIVSKRPILKGLIAPQSPQRIADFNKFNNILLTVTSTLEFIESLKKLRNEIDKDHRAGKLLTLRDSSLVTEIDTMLPKMCKINSYFFEIYNNIFELPKQLEPRHKNLRLTLLPFLHSDIVPIIQGYDCAEDNVSPKL